MANNGKERRPTYYPHPSLKSVIFCVHNPMFLTRGLVFGLKRRPAENADRNLNSVCDGMK